MIRILHTADWQIGRQFGRFSPDDAAALAEARFAVVARIAEVAATESVDAVLVAGDVFDAQTLADRTLYRTFQAMEGFSGPWILLPGNHDAALAESVWTRAERLAAVPDNVRILDRPAVCVYADVGFAVLPAPLTQRQTPVDLTEWFDTAETPTGLVRIGLAHGSIAERLPEAADAPNPIAADRAVRARLDYLALGDWHGTQAIDDRTWYSGTPEPDRFKDNGAGQVLLVELEGPGVPPRVTAHAVGRHAWIQRHWSLAVASDLDLLLRELAAWPPMSVIDLSVAGQLDLAGHQRLEQALAAAAGRHRSLQCATTDLRLQPAEADIAALRADGYLGEVVAELQSRQERDVARDTARDALAILAGLLLDPGRQERQP